MLIHTYLQDDLWSIIWSNLVGVLHYGQWSVFEKPALLWPMVSFQKPHIFLLWHFPSIHCIKTAPIKTAISIPTLKLHDVPRSAKNKQTETMLLPSIHAQYYYSALRSKRSNKPDSLWQVELSKWPLWTEILGQHSCRRYQEKLIKLNENKKSFKNLHSRCLLNTSPK